jgi:hypothetical protein
VPPRTPDPARFAVSELVVDPMSVLPGQLVAISTTITNGGGTAGVYVVNLRINGAPEGVETISVEAGATSTATFKASRLSPGNYEVSVNGLASSFTVSEPEPTAATAAPEPTQTPLLHVAAKGANWLALGVGFGALVAVAALVAVVVTRRRR